MQNFPAHHPSGGVPDCTHGQSFTWSGDQVVLEGWGYRLGVASNVNWWGQLYLYTPGEPTAEVIASVPQHRKETYTVWHEHVLHPGQQVTLEPNQPHWFQGGPDGAVVWCFSTKAVDVEDIFTDPEIRRETIVVDEIG